MTSGMLWLLGTLVALAALFTFLAGHTSKASSGDNGDDRGGGGGDGDD
jgi:hypothetical protein